MVNSYPPVNWKLRPRPLRSVPPPHSAGNLSDHRQNDGAEPLDASESVLLQAPHKPGVSSGRRREHGLQVSQGGVLDEWVLDRKLDGAGEGRGGGGRRRRCVRQEVLEAGVGLEGGHFDVVGEIQVR